jgi:hypothetical protein
MNLGTSFAIKARCIESVDADVVNGAYNVRPAPETAHAVAALARAFSACKTYDPAQLPDWRQRLQSALCDSLQQGYKCVGIESGSTPHSGANTTVQNRPARGRLSTKHRPFAYALHAAARLARVAEMNPMSAEIPRTHCNRWLAIEGSFCAVTRNEGPEILTAATG